MSTPPISPNLITLLRLPLAPAAVAFLLTGTVWGTITAAVLALLLEITDLADGYVARKYGAVTTFGKLFDPFADAFSRYTLFLGLLGVGVADLWMVIAIFYRDSSVSFFRSIGAVQRVVVAARPSGKIKAVIQGVGTQLIFILLVGRAFFPDEPLLESSPWWVMLFMTVATMLSFVDYLVGNLPILRASWNQKPE
ncbi:MAG: CDP-alcohol phosphatidyltransferase family protein [Deltaproteobacteria bacterium]|nr:CDP-alcohol phosphatidyltransferase family protein [Deltaproteobacteria bacterium]